MVLWYYKSPFLFYERKKLVLSEIYGIGLYKQFLSRTNLGIRWSHRVMQSRPMRKSCKVSSKILRSATRYYGAPSNPTEAQ